MKATLAGPTTAEFEIRKSRFIVWAGPLADPGAFPAFLAGHADPEARHNCWAWRVGDQYRFHDADEPAGTAGRPILQAIDGQGLDQVAVVVTRWFGGIKLGAGGLVRAYGGSAAECLRQAAKRDLVPFATLAVTVPFAWAGVLHHLLQVHGGTKTDEVFDESGLRVSVRLPESSRGAFALALADQTRGQAVVEDAGG